MSALGIRCLLCKVTFINHHDYLHHECVPHRRSSASSPLGAPDAAPTHSPRWVGAMLDVAFCAALFSFPFLVYIVLWR